MFLNPYQIIEEIIGITHGTRLADFGCGRGDFSIISSNFCGKKGQVYAIDIRKEALSALKSNVKAFGKENVLPIMADIERQQGSTLKDEAVHCIILSNALHQMVNKETAVREAHRVLKPGGKVFFIDWHKETGKIGPPRNIRIEKENARNLFEIRGFNLDWEFPAGNYHYGMVFKKI